MRFAHGAGGVHRVNDENHVRQHFHFADAAQQLLQAVKLFGEAAGFFFGNGFKYAGGFPFFQFVHAFNGFLDGLEVGQRAAQPFFMNAVYACARSFGGDGFLGLFFGADEQKFGAFFGFFFNKSAGFFEFFGGFLQV